MHQIYFVTAQSASTLPQQLRQLAMFAAIRRASSLVSSLATERRPGSSSK
jgi:hypothetical protein